jgi:hypothetical protein
MKQVYFRDRRLNNIVVNVYKIFYADRNTANERCWYYVGTSVEHGGWFLRMHYRDYNKLRCDNIDETSSI